MGENHLAPLPTAAYGVVMVAAAIAYTILQAAIVAQHGPDSKLARSLGGDRKGKISLLLYASAVPLAFVRPWISGALYVIVAGIWFIPDRRIEHALHP